VNVDNTHIIEAPEEVELEGGNGTLIALCGKRAGTATISFSYDDNSTFYKLDKVQREVSIIHSKWVYYLSMVVGWIYFVAWSVSFYPQIIENFWRRSVVGLNFDYLALNITGFIAYGVFNVGLFWIPKVKEQYKDKHPGGINPVQINDVVFTLHAIAATGFTIFQCFIFERGKQRVSVLTWILLAILWLTVFISLFVVIGGKLSWLNFLYVFSYVKLVVTLIKYIPQVCVYTNMYTSSKYGLMYSGIPNTLGM
jgi:cystinosin